MSEHWAERSERVDDHGIHRWCLAEDEYGDLLLPVLKRPGRWKTRLDMRKPWHWPSYFLSRVTGKLVMVERDA